MCWSLCPKAYCFKQSGFLCSSDSQTSEHIRITWTLKLQIARFHLHIRTIQKRYIHDPGNHDGVITHLEPDILECEVRWTLGSITMSKATEGDGIPAELFQILQDDAVKVLNSICQQIWKTQQWPQDWNRPVFIPIPQQDNVKECSNYLIIALTSHAS